MLSGVNDVEVFNALCRSELSAFTAKAFSIVEPSQQYMHNWHIDAIAEHLMAVWDGEIRNLIINMPPRTLKTHTTSVCFPTWCLGQDPSTSFILTSFKADLAEEMTRKANRVMHSDWYKQLFPRTRISPDLDRQYYFKTTEQGNYYSSSMSSVTGFGADIVICDDPLNPNQAASDVERLAAIDTIKGTLFSRFNDPRTGRFILNMQRLHEADPTGELMRESGFVHLKLPAEAIGRTYPIICRDRKWELKQGELLFPERLSRSVLDGIRKRMSDANYNGQYLQEPVPLGGGELRPEWIQYYDTDKINAKRMNIVILVDPSGGEDINKKKRKLSDWTAMMVVGLSSDNNYYLLDIVRERLNPTERVEKLFELHQKWNKLCGKPPKVGYEKYGMMTDTHYIKNKMSDDFYHFPLVELGGNMNKEERIRKLIPDFENNRWYFPKTMLYIDKQGNRIDLIDEIVKVEMALFPRSRYDDMIDALSRIYTDKLNLVFPRPNLTMTQKAINGLRRKPTPRSWKDF